jgi:hypothetical protein
MGVIAKSAPKLNKPMPTIRKNEHAIKVIVSDNDRSIIGVRLRKITIAITGSTEIRASFIFFKRTAFKAISLLAEIL